VIDTWKALIEHLPWPTTTLVLAFAFRKPLTNLVGRIDSLKAPGLELSTSARQQQQLPPSPTSDLLKESEHKQMSLPIESEDSIKRREAVKTFGGNRPITLNAIKDLKYQLTALGFQLTGTETEEVLLRHLAYTQLMWRAEVGYRLIFGSQIAAMRKLKSAGSQPESEIRPFYERARKESPQFYAEYGFDSWISFIVESRGIALQDGLYALTPEGNEFLEWIDEIGLPQKAF
jgi:hypothetical protein